MNLQAELAGVNLVELRTKLFKEKHFDFICRGKNHAAENKIHEKQRQALCILTDDITEEFAYGGAAGGAKSWTGAAWLTFMSISYEGTKWFVGRAELKALLGSTYITFLKVFKKYGLQSGKDWKYNGQYNYFEFSNGSRIDLLNMAFLPKDPMFERFGSLEYTGGWIEEAGEIAFAAYDTIKTRVGRHLNDKFKILGKVFITLNPKKNWVHTYFWKPFKDNLLTPSVQFLQALVQDNPFIEANYIDKLKGIKDKVKKERLLFGNFDYDDDENALMSYDAIADLFTNTHAEKGKKYITADIARFGKDTSNIYEWDGWLVVKRHVLVKKSVTQVAEYIKALANQHKIPMSQIIADEDGVGGGVVDILHCKGFVNGSAALENPKSKEKENYENLKTQCSYMAAACVNERTIGFSPEVAGDITFSEKFTEEAEQVKRRDADSDKKLRIVPKETVKELIGRSPDDWDCFMMRQWFELKPKARWVEIDL